MAVVAPRVQLRVVRARPLEPGAAEFFADRGGGPIKFRRQ